MPPDEVRTRDASKVFLRRTDTPVTFALVRSKYHVLEIEDLHFDFDSAVLLPDVRNRPPDDGTQAEPRITSLAILAKALTYARDNGAQKLLICGHTDTVGPASYNVGLGEKRGDSACFILTGDRNGWKRIVGAQNKPEDMDVILKWLARDWGWDCDPAAMSRTNAIKGMQRQYNVELAGEHPITVDGVMGPESWGAVFDIYQTEIKEILDVDDAGLATLRGGVHYVDSAKKAVGCGESFPVEAMERDEYKSEENRRIELLFFDDGDQPTLRCHPNRGICKPKECEVYHPLAYEPEFIPVDPILPRKVRVRVRLQLSWKDPEGTEHLFPKDLTLKAVYGDGSTEDHPLEADGKLAFLADKRKNTVTLKYESTEVRYIASAAADADPAPENPERWVLAGELVALRTEGFRVWMPAKKWSLAETIWDVSGATTWADPNFNLGSATEIGTRDTPQKMILDPKWQYVRLEFFDRFYGQANHGNARVAVPAVILDGFKAAPANSATPADTRSDWVKSPADNAAASLALPWMLQRKADATPEAQPRPGFMLGLVTEAKTFVESESETVRKVKKIDAAARLAPSAERLKLYDLPERWLSRKYFTRLQGAAGKFFESLTQAELTDSLTHAKRLTFSLDDIVLTDASRRQIALAANERPLVFFHSFDRTAPGASSFTLSNEGVYKPGANAAAPPAEPYYPYSDLPLPVRYYIDDYPDWVRLIVARGNLHDVFADRTADVAGNDVVGARAAVLWVDYIANGPAPVPGVNPARPGRTDNPFFSIQPFFEQEYDKRFFTRATGVYDELGSPYPYTAGDGIGRFDMALIRCTGTVAGAADTEQAILLHFFRVNIDTSATPATIPNTPPPGTPFVAATFRKNWLDNVPKRWNSPDTGNPDVPWLVPQDAAHKLKTKAFWIAQETPRPRAHFHLPVTAVDRAYMASDGTGEAGMTNDTADGAGGFVAAHECGHAGSLPDEYNERWSDLACSYHFQSFFSRTPGDPYSIIPPGDQMFEGLKMVRPRYYWHDAEFVATVTGWPHQVEQGTFKFRHRQHLNKPKRTFNYYPLVWKVQSTGFGTGSRGACDLMLYDLGLTSDGTNALADHFRENIIAGQTFDGLLLVQINMRLSFPAAVVDNDIFGNLNRMHQGITANIQKKFKLVGDVGTRHFANALVWFTPRYLVANSTADATWYHRGLGFSVAPPASPVPAVPGGLDGWPTAAARLAYFNTIVVPELPPKVQRIENNLTKHHSIICDNTGATAWTSNQNLHYRLPATPETDFWHWFGDMAGLGTSPTGAPSVGAIQTLVRQIVPNANVTNV